MAIFVVLASAAAILNLAYGAWMILAKRTVILAVHVAIFFILLGLGNIIAILYRTATTEAGALLALKLYFTGATLGSIAVFEASLMLPLTPAKKWMHLLSLPLILFDIAIWRSGFAGLTVRKSRVGWELVRSSQLWVLASVYVYLLATLALVILYGFYRTQTNPGLKQAAKWFLFGGVVFLTVSLGYYIPPIYYNFPDPIPLSSTLFLLATIWGFRHLGEPALVKVALSQTLLDVSPDLIFVISPDLEILYFNKAVEHYLPLVRSATHLTDRVVFGPDFDPNKRRQEIEVSDRVLLVESISLTDRWGQPGYLVIGRDITETKRLMKQLEDLSITDPLTGLFNRRYLTMKLEQEAARAKELGTDFLVFMVDLDNFKAINDGIGHQAGDEVLKQVASIMKSQFRDTDTVARYGGDEFAGILATDDLEKGKKALHRVLNTVSSTEFSWDGRKIKVSFSAGLTSFRCSGGRLESLLAVADMALYDAKNSGKGAVRVRCPRDVKH